MNGRSDTQASSSGSDECGAAHHVHHLLAAYFTDDGADFRGGDQLAHDTIFEAL